MDGPSVVAPGIDRPRRSDQDRRRSIPPRSSRGCAIMCACGKRTSAWGRNAMNAYYADRVIYYGKPMTPPGGARRQAALHSRLSRALLRHRARHASHALHARPVRGARRPAVEAHERARQDRTGRIGADARLFGGRSGPDRAGIGHDPPPAITSARGDWASAREALPLCAHVVSRRHDMRARLAALLIAAFAASSRRRSRRSRASSRRNRAASRWRSSRAGWKTRGASRSCRTGACW